MSTARILFSLDRAISCAAEVRSARVGELPDSANIASWPVTGVQIPWDEWVALIRAIREQQDDA